MIYFSQCLGFPDLKLENSSEICFSDRRIFRHFSTNISPSQCEQKLTISNNFKENDDFLESMCDFDSPDVGAVKHCRSCWRKEVHYPVTIPPFALGFMLIFSLGTVLLIRPNRCACCGKTRLF